MAKKNKPKKKRSPTFPLTIVVPVGMTAYRRVDEITRNVDPFEIMDRQIYELTGYSVKFQNWKWDRLHLGLFPIVGGIIAHKIVNKLGVNRAIAAAGVPWIRI